MKRMSFFTRGIKFFSKALAVMLAVSLELSLFSCSDSGSSESPDIAPGTVGEANPVLIATSELAKKRI